jgi:thymidine phosphorylase
MVKAQGGDISYVENPQKLPLGERREIYAAKSGYLSSVKTRRIGLTLVNLGGGRIKKEDKIDSGAGIELFVEIGDKVQKGQKLAVLYHGGKNVEQSAKDIEESLIISAKKPLPQKDAYAYVDTKGVTFL